MWQVIGAMNNIENSTGKKEPRIKLIRTDSIGAYSYDSSDESINNGFGINNWNTSKIKTILNDYYYNGLDKEDCFIGENNEKTTCNFSHIGLSSEAKTLIEEAVWYTHIKEVDPSTEVLFNPAKRFYEIERSVEKEKQWLGIIGLMYPSDYGFAAVKECVDTDLANRFDADCTFEKNWLYNPFERVISTCEREEYPSCVFTLNEGNLLYDDAHYIEGNYNVATLYTRPTVYLKANVKKVSGSGTKEDPFTLSLNE